MLDLVVKFVLSSWSIDLYIVIYYDDSCDVDSNRGSVEIGVEDW